MGADDEQDSDDRDTDDEEGEEAEVDGDSDEDEDSDEEEEQFTLDELGRVPGGILPHNPMEPELNYDFRCFPSFLAPSTADLEKLQADCRSTFTARTTRKGQKYSAGETYWLAADARPRCALESLAKDVFDLHTKGMEPGVHFDAAKSGAEWWTLVLDAGDDVGLHWDRDYEMESSAEILVHPHLSTVTYLTDIGGPTVVLGCISPMESHALRGVVGPVDEAFLSRPAQGKHISFDGRMLHGAPADADVWTTQTLAAGGAAQTRITFLVNVWLNHVPSSAEPFHADKVAELGAADLLLRSSGTEPTEEAATALEIEGDSDTHKVIEMGFVAHRPVKLRLPLPAVDLRGTSDGGVGKGGSWLLKFPVKEGGASPNGPCRIYPSP